MVSVNSDAIPQALKERRQWLLWDASTEMPRRPHWRGDFEGISWSDPTDWHTFEDAVEAANEVESWGIGYVFRPNTPYYAIDVDGCLTGRGDPKDWLPSLEPFEGQTYIERSPSGDGLHIVIEGEPPDWWTDSEFANREHEGVEVLNNKFCTVTGDVIESSADDVGRVDASGWLADAWEAIRDEPAPPRRPDPDPVDGEFDGDEWLDAEAVADALDHLDPDLEYNEWLRVGFAVHDFDSGSTGRGLFEEWSRGGSKWDRAAERTINWIWENAGQGDGVTIATLVYLAREAGWEGPSSTENATGDGVAADPDAGEGSDSGGDGERGSADDDEPGVPTWEDVVAMFDRPTTEVPNRIQIAMEMAADRLDYEFDFMSIRETGTVYFYDEARGIYVRKGETYINEILEAEIGGRMNDTRKSNIWKKIRDRHQLSLDEARPPKGKLCLLNGVLDMETRELEAHTPEYFFTSRVNAEWPENGEPDPHAEALWLHRLHNVTPLPAERRKIEEFGGYILESWHHDLEMNLAIVGPPQSGKGTIQEAIEGLIGAPPSVVNLTPQEIADKRFDGERLRDAMLNTRNDIDSESVENVGKLKAVLSGEKYEQEAKHQDPEFGRSFAKHLWTANFLPKLTGDDLSMYRRLLLVEFPNSLPDAEKVPSYKKRLWHPDVRSAMLIRFLDARDRLREQGDFTNNRNRRKTHDLYVTWLSSLHRFLFTQFEITKDPDDTFGRQEFTLAYQQYCTREGYNPKSRRAVTNTLQWIPGVYTQGSDDYQGLIPHDDIDVGDPDATVHTTLDQAERMLNIKGWIRESDGETPVMHKRIIDRAVEAGISQSRAEHALEKLLERGEIYEVATGEYRIGR